MALVAVSLSGLIPWSSSMAFNPSGVAAFPNPRILADIFNTIEPMAGWSSGTSGNRRRVIGRSPFAIRRMSPDSSAIFIMPNQSAIIPMRPIAKFTATLAISIAAAVTASMFPVNMPTTTPINIIPNQM